MKGKFLDWVRGIVLISILYFGIVSCTLSPLEDTSTREFSVTPAPTLTATPALIPSFTSIVPFLLPTVEETQEVVQKEQTCAGQKHTTSSRLADGWLNNYVGTLGDETLGMTLIYSSHYISGTYFCRSDLIDYRLDGCLGEGRSIVIQAYDANGAVIANLNAEFAEFDSMDRKLQRELIVGEWRDMNTSKTISISLKLDNVTSGPLDHRYAGAGAESDQVVEQGAQAFWQAVVQDDRNQVVSVIVFPVWVTINGERMALATADEFLDHYDEVFTDVFRENIRKAIPHNMFANWQGIMLGNGEIWFDADGKVVVINN
ncbi:MAG: hypothetical protein JXA21_19110 [Anaerolineae bacterium]|nr:hypothetical protein [Anaerolineae bacterium]